MLVHWPCITAAETAAVWTALEGLLAVGKLKSIGVSNFKSADIETLMQTAKVVPSINQCPMAAGKGNTDVETLHYCKMHNITYEAYGGLQGGNMQNPAVVGCPSQFHLPFSDLVGALYERMVFGLAIFHYFVAILQNGPPVFAGFASPRRSKTSVGAGTGGHNQA
jgi:hypothetical protein